MQLSKIKIAGFKSFVDPTTIAMPGSLVAVVGPNGCGKSNIIDAVTWVMGESSPKYLRGESLTDVIFNGSNTRKPVGQASVELIFDNQDAKIGGEYAQFSEISVKRLINRESDSSYYLNGVRCRKRDIVGIFLGTGIGPRSYSIIGQNMISRMIEAKPDELRTYLEEAAGISKYKERRHETELRIKHTKENLDRVQDVHAELEKQLAHLKQQANTAEKYKTLKQQERTLKAEWLAIQWRELDHLIQEHSLKIQKQTTALEAKQSELTHTESKMENVREEQGIASSAYQEIQSQYYALGNDVTRIEQEILHQKEKRQQRQADLDKTVQESQDIQDEIQTAEDELQDYDDELQQVQPQLTVAKNELERMQNVLIKAEDLVQACQVKWDKFNQNVSNLNQTVQVENNNIQHYEQRLEDLQHRQVQIEQEQSLINIDDLKNEVTNLEREVEEAATSLKDKQENINTLRQTINGLQTQQQDSLSKLDLLRSDLQRLCGKQSSLEALQETALGRSDHMIAPWVIEHNLEKNPRLAQEIQVEKGWELAVEKVLGLTLQAICVDDIHVIVPKIKAFSSGNVCIFAGDNLTDQPFDQGERLLDKVQSARPLEGLLGGIYCAKDLEAALQLAKTLKPYESVVTQDGFWVNATWIKILREEDPAAGVLQREHTLKEIAAEIGKLQSAQNELEAQIASRREEIEGLEKQYTDQQQILSQHQAQVAQLNAQHKVKLERIIELSNQKERYQKENEQCLLDIQNLEKRIVASQQAHAQAYEKLTLVMQQKQELIEERDAAREKLHAERELVNNNKENVHELEMRLQTALSQKKSLHQTIDRLQAQYEAIQERAVVLTTELEKMPSLEVLENKLKQKLDEHLTLKVEVDEAREATEALSQDYQELERKKVSIEKELNQLRQILENLRLDLQGWKVKSETLSEQLAETTFQLNEIIQTLSDDADVQECQKKLEQMTNRINRLGPINLVAIEEYATNLERKEHLDAQLNDLQTGMQTLEDAIAKIDKETKSRFKDTFDKVNEHFQTLFPTVFGGGKAYLELNSDDLLTAGVTMMACPPGKRNSSIYLLSGGEKSMTAIALIFSIFQLNPAPFCLLDEVDAALDDANVQRFTKLVKTMTNHTQFIFISHNKITIEMGEHLIGVTMNEPGVSRLVSVDVDKAINMAGA